MTGQRWKERKKEKNQRIGLYISGLVIGYCLLRIALGEDRAQRVLITGIVLPRDDCQSFLMGLLKTALISLCMRSK